MFEKKATQADFDLLMQKVSFIESQKADKKDIQYVMSYIDRIEDRLHEMKKIIDKKGKTK